MENISLLVQSFPEFGVCALIEQISVLLLLARRIWGLICSLQNIFVEQFHSPEAKPLTHADVNTPMLC